MNFNILSLIILVLCTYRVTDLFSRDIGPFKLFENIRNAFGKRAQKYNGFFYNLSELIHCPHCLGLWMSLIMFILYWWLSKYFIVFAFFCILAISGFQSFLVSIRKEE